MVIARVRLDKQNSNAGKKCWKIAQVHGNLRGLIVDWSDAQNLIKGLQIAVGNDTVERLLKGCRVHWIQLCHRVAEKVSLSYIMTSTLFVCSFSKTNSFTYQCNISNFMLRNTMWYPSM